MTAIGPRLSDSELVAIIRADLFLNLALALLLLIQNKRSLATPANAARSGASAAAETPVLLRWVSPEAVRLGGEVLSVGNLTARITNAAPLVVELPPKLSAAQTVSFLDRLHAAVPSSTTSLITEP